MSLRRIVLGVIVGVAVTASCHLFRSGIRIEKVSGGVEKVVARHDAYVIADEALTDDQEAGALGQSAALSQLLQLESIPVSKFKPVALPVLARHDAYIQADESVTEIERRMYMRTSSELRGLAKTD